MPEQGFNKQAFLAACAGERDEAFQSATAGRGAKPPDGDYLCELVGCRLGIVEKDGSPYVALDFRVAKGEQKDFKFGDLWACRENNAGIVKELMRNVYGDVQVPKALGEALLGCHKLAGCGRHYVVRIKSAGGYTNVYVNQYVAPQEAEDEAQQPAEATAS